LLKPAFAQAYRVLKPDSFCISPSGFDSRRPHHLRIDRSLDMTDADTAGRR
jgi:hypothetical protein